MRVPPRFHSLRLLYTGLVALQLVPVWSVERMPTLDGPCHVYNAWIWRQQGNAAEFPQLARHFEVKRAPQPNLLGHGLMAAAMRAVSPQTAEKLLVSLCLVVFLGGAWYLAGSAGSPPGPWAFVAFPFAFHHLLHLGFYNHSLGLGLSLLAVGYIWRRRSAPTPRRALAANLLLLLCWLAHLVPHAAALLGIAGLGAARLRGAERRSTLRWAAALAPQLLLPILFLLEQGGASSGGDPLPVAARLRQLLRLEGLVVFDFSEAWATTLLALLLLALALGTFRRDRRGRGSTAERREADAFLAAALVLAAALLVAPASLGGGLLLPERLALYPYLLLLPWLWPRPSRRLAGAAVVLLSATAVVQAAYHLRWYRLLDREVERFLAPLDAVPPHQRLLTVLFDTASPAARVAVFNHAVGYVAATADLVDWGNYEATLDYFQVRFRPGLERPDLHIVEAAPRELDFAALAPAVDYVYAWRLPRPSPAERRLTAAYELVRARGDGRLYRRRRAAAAPGPG
jgi:hypothetical protein